MKPPAADGRLPSENLPSLLEVVERRHQAHQDRLASEVHDKLGSALTALAMRLAALERATGSTVDHVAWQKVTQQVIKISQSARSIQQQLRPMPLDVLPFEDALDDYLVDFSKRTGIACQLQSNPLDLSPEIANVVWRIIEEALQNVARHAEATTLQIELKKDNHQCRFSIVDDGRGFTQSDIDWQRCHGIRLIHARAGFLRGKIALDSSPGNGCRLVLTYPVESQ